MAAKMLVQIENGFTVGEADFNMTDFTYEHYNPLRLYMKMHEGSPI